MCVVRCPGPTRPPVRRGLLTPPRRVEGAADVQIFLDTRPEEREMGRTVICASSCVELLLVVGEGYRSLDPGRILYMLTFRGSARSSRPAKLM